jgi:hypothetical protein
VNVPDQAVLDGLVALGYVKAGEKAQAVPNAVPADYAAFTVLTH